MIKKSIYVSLPITGMPEGQQESIAASKRKMLAKEYDVITPFDLQKILDGICKEHGSDPNYIDYLFSDIVALMLCDAIYMCHGWEYSKGCLAEFYFARAIGIDIIYED